MSDYMRALLASFHHRPLEQNLIPMSSAIVQRTRSARTSTQRKHRLQVNTNRLSQPEITFRKLAVRTDLSYHASQIARRFLDWYRSAFILHVARTVDFAAQCAFGARHLGARTVVHPTGRIAGCAYRAALNRLSLAERPTPHHEPARNRADRTVASASEKLTSSGGQRHLLLRSAVSFLVRTASARRCLRGSRSSRPIRSDTRAMTSST